MLDINLLRKQLDDVVARLATRPFEFPVKEFNALENDRKAIQKQTEELQALRNSLSKQIGAARKAGGDAAELMAEAAAIPEAFATSYLNLFIEGNAKKGETLLMNAGASGLASVVIPMAKAFGLRVITTVLTQEIADSIRHLNVDRVVVTGQESIGAAMKEELEAGHGVDIAIDCLGGSAVSECLPYMERDGRWIIIATLAGDETQIDMKLMYKRSLRIIGNTLRARTPKVKAEILSALVRDVWPKVESGEVLPTIYKTLPIEKAEEAHAILQRGENVGKVVLVVKEN